jgi:hypothetical protein
VRPEAEQAMAEQADVDIARLGHKLDAFRASMHARFDQLIELLEDGFRAVKEEIASLKRN